MEMEAAMVLCGNEGEMEDNGVFLQCADGGVWEAVRRGRVCSGRGGRRLQCVVATAQWVARVVAWKN